MWELRSARWLAFAGAGALIGAAVVSGPVYVTPGYRDCRLVERYDRWGNVRVIRVCDY